MMKQLTITIPAYNAEAYIEKCLASFTGEGDFLRDGYTADDRLEILVINDGSTDRTAELAEAYAERFPSMIKVINKENGGHGSGINTGIIHAKGRYFKVVDADDWVVTENIKNILALLEKTEADVIVTGYKSITEQTGKIQEYPAVEGADRRLELNGFAESFEEHPAAFQFHGLCYRTDFYRSLDIQMSEGVFYEDQEYAILPFLKAQTIHLFPYYFYIYRLGRGGQSVNYESIRKRLGDMREVLEKLIRMHKEASGREEWTEEREQFFQKRLLIAVTSYFAALLVKARDPKNGKAEAERFKLFLDREEPQLSKAVNKKYQALLMAGKLPHAAGVVDSLSDSAAYRKFKKIWNK